MTFVFRLPTRSAKHPGSFVFSLIIAFLTIGGCGLFAQDAPAQERTDSEADATTAPPVVVEGRAESLLEVAESASVGRIGQNEIEKRPLLRTGELLEAVPGLIVTQHSGTGKANQYFLRGFNLDHGTDFRVEVDGMPVNMPSHGHGQGYSDVNFVIPELVQRIDYKKGVYYAEEGDFSSAGAADFVLFRSLPHGIADFGFGEDLYARAVVADSIATGGGDLLGALELQHSDGPWDLDENFRKFNFLLRHTSGNSNDSFTVTALGYHAIWDSTDQIPLRAVESGLIGDLGYIDPTDGGRTSRYSLSADWDRKSDTKEQKANLYAIYYELSLFSNFTYFLDNPVDGDQFEQADQRVVLGGELSDREFHELFGLESATTVGLQVRSDIIPEVALRKTAAREELSTVREDDIWESSIGVYASNETTLVEKVRATVGVRGDLFLFDVNSDQRQNSGDEFDGKVSPKGGIVFGPWADTEFYVNGGLGFHSNDARGVTARVDPTTGDPIGKADALVLSRGGEVGVRTSAVEGLSSTATFFALDLSQELVFIGDGGTTEATRPSRRYGVELANFYRPASWLALDLDYSISHSRYRDESIEGDYIPGSIEQVLAAGIAADSDRLFGALRLRYFGPRPLIEDNSVESDSTTLLNLETGVKFGELRAALQVLNLLDSEDHDIDYFYASRLEGEPDEGIDDIHFHPVEPRSFRVAVSYRF